MSFYLQQVQQQQQLQAASHPSLVAHHHHGARTRRMPRQPSQNPHRQFRGVKGVKDMSENPSIIAYRQRYEAAKSFDLEDDMEFFPWLLTEDDLHSNSSSSDRSSLSSGSPDSSPLQSQSRPQQYNPSFTYTSPSHNIYNLSPYNDAQFQMKIHQPSAIRTRNAIPIVNPTTGLRAN